MLCKILKSFPFSRDGINSEQAGAGETMDIPEALVPGLEKGGLVQPTKAMGAAPEIGGPVAIETAEEPAPRKRGRPRKVEK